MHARKAHKSEMCILITQKPNPCITTFQVKKSRWLATHIFSPGCILPVTTSLLSSNVTIILTIMVVIVLLQSSTFFVFSPNRNAFQKTRLSETNYLYVLFHVYFLQLSLCSVRFIHVVPDSYNLLICLLYLFYRKLLLVSSMKYFEDTQFINISNY